MDTTDKSLKDRAIDIKGKDYVLVADRVLYFNEVYPNGSITTERLAPENGVEIIKATVYPDCDKPARFFTWYSQAKRGEWYINKTSALENAETSAVGRALAMMGIGVIDSIASVDEINKAENTAKAESKPAEKKEELPRFNKPEIEKLKGATEYLKKFDTSDALIKDILTKYRISNDTKREIADIWASVK